MQFLLSKSLSRLSRLYSRAITRVLPELKFEHHAEILLILAYTNRRLTQKELAELYQADKSRIAVLIEGMTRDGLVYTEQNCADRRAHFVLLTSKGEEIIPKIQQAIEQVNCMINQQLDKTHLDYFYATLFKMQSNLVEVQI